MDLNFTVFPHPPTPSPGRGDVGCYYVYKNNFIMDRVQAQQIVRALSEIRERVQEDKKMASKPGDKLEMPIIDRGGSKKAPNSLNNGDKPEMTVLDR